MINGRVALIDECHRPYGPSFQPVPTSSNSPLTESSARRNSDACGAFRSGSSTSASSASGASFASDGSTRSDSSRGSFGPKATHHPLELSASVYQLLQVLEKFPDCSISLKNVVRRVAELHDADISSSVHRFNRENGSQTFDLDECFDHGLEHHRGRFVIKLFLGTFFFHHHFYVVKPLYWVQSLSFGSFKKRLIDKNGIGN